MDFQEETVGETVIQEEPFRERRNFQESRRSSDRVASVFLQPVAAPSILGLFSFAGATFVMAVWLVGWFSTVLSSLYLGPFAGIFGGVAQLIAAVWAFRARDGVATAIHGTWGGFFLAYAALQITFVLQPALIPRAVLYPELGVWFIPLAAISWVLSLAAMGQRWSLAAVMMSVSIGSTLAAIGLLTATLWCVGAGGYFLLLSSLCALYDAGAQVLKEVYGHEVLKLGYAERILDKPGIMVGAGEPGVIHGQR